MIIPKVLLDRCLAGKCVAFIGAGFSMPCGMPSWTGLMWGLFEDVKEAKSSTDQDTTFEKIEALLRKGSLPDAVALLRQIMPKSELNVAIGRRFDRKMFEIIAPQKDRERMQLRIENLVATPWSGIVTTNYDTLIEYGIDNYTTGRYEKCRADDENFGLMLSAQKNGLAFFTKLHGSVDGGGYVIGTDEYERTYIKKKHVKIFLEALMLQHHVVFVGCSLEDEVLKIRKSLSNVFYGVIPTAYALLPETKANRERSSELMEKASIVPILYDADDPERLLHIEVDNFIETLCRFERASCHV